MVSFYISDTVLQASFAVASWVPYRQDIIWIDCNPQTGREMRDVHHFLVLCHQPFAAFSASPMMARPSSSSASLAVMGTRMRMTFA